MRFENERFVKWAVQRSRCRAIFESYSPTVLLSRLRQYQQVAPQMLRKPHSEMLNCARLRPASAADLIEVEMYTESYAWTLWARAAAQAQSSLEHFGRFQFFSVVYCGYRM